MMEPRPHRRSLGRLLRLTRKELRETLRDRRTVITLVLMPLLVYPLMSICFYKLFFSSAQDLTKRVVTIGFESEQDWELLESYLAQGNDLLAARESRSAAKGPAPLGSGDAPRSWDSVEVSWFPDSPLENHVSNRDVQVAVRIKRPARQTRPGGWAGPIQCELIYRQNSQISESAMHFVEDRLQAVNTASLRNRLARVPLPSGVPAGISRKPLVLGNQTSFSLATLVPLVLILMTITGAVYPSIDLTAGERERGTLETLIAAPISRMALLVAKYVAVLTVAVLTAMINLVAMTVTVLASGLSAFLFPSGLSFTLVVEIFGLMILFAAFFSAILLALTSCARSFKEAQAYLIPVMLLAISPGLLSLMPGLELNGLLAVTPLVNIVLLSRDLLEQSTGAGITVLVIGSTACYALLALVVAARIFGTDALLYASRGSWSDLFRRPAALRVSPSPATTIACLVVMFPCYFLLAHLARSLASSVYQQLILNALVTVAVFGACPLMFAAAQRVHIRPGFLLHRPPLFATGGALIMGLALWPFAHELFLLGKWLGLATLDKSQFADAERLLRTFMTISPAVVLLTLAVVPAVLEEFFFRGFLFHGLRERFSGRGAVVLSALLFGLFHVLDPSMLTPERFLPSTFLGLALGWVCYRTGSVLPGMLLHTVHNGLLLSLARYRDLLMRHGWDMENREHLPGTWLAVAAVVGGVGLLLVYVATRRRMSVSRQTADPDPTEDGDRATPVAGG